MFLEIMSTTFMESINSFVKSAKVYEANNVRIITACLQSLEYHTVADVSICQRSAVMGNDYHRPMQL